MRKVKVLHVHNSYLPQRTGGARRISYLVEGINNSGMSALCDVVVVENDAKKNEEWEVINGVRVLRVQYYWRLLVLLKRLQKAEGYDLWHIHNARPLFFSFLACRKVKKIVEFHSLQPMKSWKECLMWGMAKRVAGIIVLSEVAKSYLENIKEVNEKSIQVISNGIPAKLFSEKIRNRFEVCDTKKRNIRFIYAGSLHYWQGIKILCEAFLRGIQGGLSGTLTIIGDGPDYDWIQDWRKRNKIENIIELEHGCDQEELWSRIRTFDYFCMPRPLLRSTYLTAPIKPYEIGMLGVPQILSDLPGLREAVGDHAIFVKPDDVDELSTVLKMCETPEVIDLANEKAKKLYEKLFAEERTWQTMSRKMEQYYINVARRK